MFSDVICPSKDSFRAVERKTNSKKDKIKRGEGDKGGNKPPFWKNGGMEIGKRYMQKGYKTDGGGRILQGSVRVSGPGEKWPPPLSPRNQPSMENMLHWDQLGKDKAFPRVHPRIPSQPPEEKRQMAELPQIAYTLA
ncbi:unnamed protein product [Cyprideis torosa]|uniref:Uncharacterized protein n=1 Tax=Cyprideis torosa TaxID=163714 RepID=A0A7R8ZT52_9CRUS|nr:unnamed protein product [Cyprideis torosa]CAG0897228.1 unnamed protein product [Cyprideis torosa]